MARMVLLQHTLPDGQSHYDWLIEPVGAGPGSLDARYADSGDPEERCLISFRVMDRIDGPRVVSFLADALPLHRRKYLQYQGDVEGKGAVKRITGGMVRKVEVLGHGKDGEINALTIRGKFTAAVQSAEYTWAGVRGEGENALWQFQRSAPGLVQNKSRLEPRNNNPFTRDLNEDPWLRL